MIGANDLRNTLLAKYYGTTNPQGEYTDVFISSILNEAIMDFVLSRIFPERNPKQLGLQSTPKRNIDLSALNHYSTTFQEELDDFMVGNSINGAYRQPDIDNQLIFLPGSRVDNPNAATMYAPFVKVPMDCLHIMSTMASIQIESTVFNNVVVEEKNPTYYTRHVNNTLTAPDVSKIWYIEQGVMNGNASTPKTGLSTYVQSNGMQNAVTFDTERCHNIIMPKNARLKTYQLHYIKKPVMIRVSITNPNFAVNSDLPLAVMPEIVNIALDILAKVDMPTSQRAQVTDATVKNES